MLIGAPTRLRSDPAKTSEAMSVSSTKCARREGRRPTGAATKQGCEIREAGMV